MSGRQPELLEALAAGRETVPVTGATQRHLAGWSVERDQVPLQQCEKLDLPVLNLLLNLPLASMNICEI